MGEAGVRGRGRPRPTYRAAANLGVRARVWKAGVDFAGDRGRAVARRRQSCQVGHAGQRRRRGRGRVRCRGGAGLADGWAHVAVRGSARRGLLKASGGKASWAAALEPAWEEREAGCTREKGRREWAEWGKKRVGPAGFGFWAGFSFSFLFLFLSNSNSNSNSRQMNSNLNLISHKHSTNKTMLQHDATTKIKPMINFNYL